MPKKERPQEAKLAIRWWTEMIFNKLCGDLSIRDLEKMQNVIDREKLDITPAEIVCEALNAASAQTRKHIRGIQKKLDKAKIKANTAVVIVGNASLK